MKSQPTIEFKNIERYLEDELKRETKFVLDRSASGACSIREEPKTEEDRLKIQEKLDLVRKQISELEGNSCRPFKF